METDRSTIYTCQVDVEKGRVRRSSEPFENYDDFTVEEIGVATYNEGGFDGVYAESLVSQEDADRIALSLCRDLRDRFAAASHLFETETK